MKYAASFASMGVIAVITVFTIQENARQSDKQINRGNQHLSKDSTYNREPVYSLVEKRVTTLR